MSLAKKRKKDKPITSSEIVPKQSCYDSFVRKKRKKMLCKQHVYDCSRSFAKTSRRPLRPIASGNGVGGLDTKETASRRSFEDTGKKANQDI